MLSEIRKNYLLNKYVIITPGRLKRPRDIKEQTIIERTKPCPFCVENIIKENIIDQINNKNSQNWQVLSIKNIFPAVTLDNPRAYGTQEVIVETRDHSKELADLSEKQIKQILQMYASRTKKIAKYNNNVNIQTRMDDTHQKINYILCFKNQGSKAGASIVHSHSQIFAAEIIPPELREESNALQNYKIKYQKCAYCEIIKKEMKSKRKIFEDNYIAAFTPYASEYHYEAWIFPKQHLDNITLLNSLELNSLAKILKKISVKMQSLDLSFNYFLHNVIPDNNQHFYIKIQPRESIWAGIELGSGIVINSVSPEQAAEYFRS